MASPSPRPLRWCGSSGQLLLRLVELLEDAALLLFGDADAGVPDLQEQLVTTAATRNEHATVFGVADGVGDQVAQDALDHQGVGVGEMLLAVKAQHQPFFECGGFEVQPDAREQVTHGEVLGLDVHAAGVDLGDVEHSLNRPSRASTELLMLLTSWATPSSLLRLRRASANRPSACRGLARVVAGCREELRFLARLAVSASRCAASAAFISPWSFLARFCA